MKDTDPQDRVRSRAPSRHSGTPKAGVGQPMPPQAKRTARAAFLGFGVDYFDIYLPVVALAPALHYFQPLSISSATQSTLFYVTFAITLIGRPIGAAIFGSLSDKFGRRKSTLIAVAGFTAATLLMAGLPGYESWGYGALVCLMILRLVGGVFMGGEYTSANPLALEACPQPKRGSVGAAIASAYPVGYIAISVVTLPLLAMLPGDGVHSAYTQWGWRIPFLVGAALGGLFFWYFYRSVGESEVWQTESRRQSTVKKTPIRHLFTDGNGARLTQVFILMSGLWFAVQAVISPMSSLLIADLEQNSQAVTAALLVANVALFFGYITFGYLGQKYGRRKVLSLAGAGTATLCAVGLFGTLRIVDDGGSFWLAMVVYTVSLVLAVSPYGVAMVYLLEAFPTRIRASGYGIAFSFSLVIPSCYSFYMLWLSSVMPYIYTPIVLVVLSGVLTLIGARLGPETKNVDFTLSTE